MHGQDEVAYGDLRWIDGDLNNAVEFQLIQIGHILLQWIGRFANACIKSARQDIVLLETRKYGC
jgi:hypothetical protein